MTNAGLESEAAFNLGVVQSCVGLLGCVIAWWIMTHVGRRRLYLTGLSGMFIILMVIGFCGIAPSSNKGASWAVGVFIVIMNIVFQVRSAIVGSGLGHTNHAVAVSRSPLLLYRCRNTQHKQPHQDRRFISCDVQFGCLHQQRHHAQDGWP